MVLGKMAGKSSENSVVYRYRGRTALRIFLSATSLAPRYGGPAYSVSQLAMALADAGGEVGMWSTDGSVRGTPLLQDRAGIARLEGSLPEVLRSFAPDLVHDNGLWLAHNHRLAQICRELGMPRIVSTRGMLEPWARRHKKWKKDLAWLAYQRRDIRSTNALHATAAAEAENLDALGLGVPVHVIPNGVHVPARRAVLPMNTRTALFMGRLYPVKGLPLLIEAWSRVRPLGWRLVLAGPDEAGHRAELEAQIDRRGLGGIISFTGSLEGQAKDNALFGAELFILPTHSESFGMVIAEALAHAVPVLTTVGAPWPALAERAIGWRTPISVDGLAVGLAEATSLDRSVLQAMGERGRAYVKAEFGWDHVARQFLATYAAIVAKSTAPADKIGKFH